MKLQIPDSDFTIPHLNLNNIKLSKVYKMTTEFNMLAKLNIKKVLLKKM
jgi:hypothetical protein